MTSDSERGTLGGPCRCARGWVGSAVRLPALPLEGELNANGAGDAFTSGMLAAMLWQSDDGASMSLQDAVSVALGSARQRVDSARRAKPEAVGDLLACTA